MKHLIFVLLYLFLLPCTFAAEDAKRPKPNIVIINIDDLGWMDLSYMGSKFYETPNIDNLSKEGVVFTNGYAGAANCAPSRACLLSGKWTTRHGIYTVGSSARGKKKRRKLIPTKNTDILSHDHVTFTQVLQRNGYKTCHAGKWHLNHDPHEFGIDVNIGGSHAGHPKSYYPPYKNVKLDAPNGEYLTDRVMTKAIEFVEATKEPFLLYYSPYAVHTPIQAVDSLKYKYKNKASWKGQSNVGYATMVDNMDRNIGLLIKALKDKGIYENTFIVFTSDNGGSFRATMQKPLRAGKGSYFEGGIRVPFFFIWKGKIRAGSDSDLPISNLDIYPTILEVAGIKDKKLNLDGESLLPMLKGKKKMKERPLFWHFPIYLQSTKKGSKETHDPHFRTRPGSVVRYGDWKLHHYFENDTYELYNLKEDIGERSNVVEQNPKKFKELKVILEKWRKEVNAPIPTKHNPAYVPLQER